MSQEDTETKPVRTIQYSAPGTVVGGVCGVGSKPFHHCKNQTMPCHGVANKLWFVVQVKMFFCQRSDSQRPPKIGKTERTNTTDCSYTTCRPAWWPKNLETRKIRSFHGDQIIWSIIAAVLRYVLVLTFLPYIVPL